MGVSPGGPTPVYLSPKEVAAEWAVDLQVVYKMLRSGKLPAERIGRCWRIPRSALWLASERNRTFTIQEVYDRLGRIESKLDELLAGRCCRCCEGCGPDVPT
jgi:excisionase family DNA binding protein